MKYEEPKMELVEIKATDVIVTSDVIDVNFDIFSAAAQSC